MNCYYSYETCGYRTNSITATAILHYLSPTCVWHDKLSWHVKLVQIRWSSNFSVTSPCHPWKLKSRWRVRNKSLGKSMWWNLAMNFRRHYTERVYLGELWKNSARWRRLAAGPRHWRRRCNGLQRRRSCTVQSTSIQCKIKFIRQWNRNEKVTITKNCRQAQWNFKFDLNNLITQTNGHNPDTQHLQIVY